MIAILRKRPGSGFSLIEMLVVVGIILVLAGAIYPALLKAKEWGRATRCASNLRQLQVATVLLATDNGGRLPQCADGWNSERTTSGRIRWTHYRGWVAWYGGWTGAPSDGPVWAPPQSGSYEWKGANGLTCITNGVLWKYVKEKDVYLCPTFAMKSVCNVTNAVRSYSMGSQASWMLLADREVKSSSVILYADALTVKDVSAGPAGARLIATNDVGRWHGVRGQAVYVDGHVDRL